MQLSIIVDPRDTLDKARRSELARYAVINGVEEIKPTMPAMLMRKILRSRGLVNPSIPVRKLGAMNTSATGLVENAPASEPEGKIEQVSATDDMMEQWLEEEKQAVEVKDENEVPALAAPTPAKAIVNMTINELRKACQARGIKLARRDNMITLRAKLNGEDLT
jgi:hypothetical protein